MRRGRLRFRSARRRKARQYTHLARGAASRRSQSEIGHPCFRAIRLLFFLPFNEVLFVFGLKIRAGDHPRLKAALHCAPTPRDDLILLHEIVDDVLFDACHPTRDNLVLGLFDGLDRLIAARARNTNQRDNNEPSRSSHLSCLLIRRNAWIRIAAHRFISGGYDKTRSSPAPLSPPLTRLRVPVVIIALMP